MRLALVVVVAGVVGHSWEGGAWRSDLPPGGAIQSLATPTTPRRGGNPAAAALKNPVSPTTESIAAGRRTYLRLCQGCHGPQAKGDGGGAVAGGQPADLTDAAWDFGSSDGEIFTVIRDGTSADMEGYAERIPEAEIWNLVNFIRSLGSKNGVG